MVRQAVIAATQPASSALIGYPAIARLATLGDSLTAGSNQIVNGDGTNYWPGGWAAHLRTVLDHKISYARDDDTDLYTFAVSGAQADAFLDGGSQRAYFLRALASDADTIAIFLGANDLSNGREAAETATDIIALWDEVLAEDKAVLALEIIGVRSDHPEAVAFRPKQVACNALLRSAASSRRIQIIRWGDLLDEDDDGYSDAKYLGDTVHTNMLGGITLANFVAEKIASRVTGETNLSFPVENAGAWITTNAYPTGTPGSNQTATGWTVNGAGNAVVAKNLVARTDGVSGYWQEIVSTGMQDEDVLLSIPTDYAQAYTSGTGSFVAGDRVRAVVEYELLDPVWGWHIELSVNGNKAGDHQHNGGLASMTEKIQAHSGVLWSEPWTWTADTAALALTKIYGNGTVRLGRMGLYKVGPAGFDPLSYANLTGWFDASDSATLFDATSGGSAVAADGTVARWMNKCGRGAPLIQGTSGARPIRKAAAVNGLDVLRFDGTDDALAANSFGRSDAAGCFIAVILDTKVSSRSYQTPIGFGSSGAAIASNAATYDYGLAKPGVYGPQATQLVTASTVTVLAVRWSGTAASVFKDGTKTTATLASGFASADALYVGQHTSAGFSFFGGDILELFAFNAAVSDAVIGEFTTAMTDKWT